MLRKKKKHQFHPSEALPFMAFLSSPCLFETLACVGWCVVTADGHIAGLAETLKQIALTFDTRPSVTFASASIRRDLLTCRIHPFIEPKTQIRIVDSTPDRWHIVPIWDLLILFLWRLVFTAMFGCLVISAWAVGRIYRQEPQQLPFIVSSFPRALDVVFKLRMLEKVHRFIFLLWPHLPKV